MMFTIPFRNSKHLIPRRFDHINLLVSTRDLSGSPTQLTTPKRTESPDQASQNIQFIPDV
ncbi:hypothetical protein FHS10_003128 [Mucilaginibacter dorajii]|nr:hypothetical protein [Mucilaginibacter dorajii]